MTQGITIQWEQVVLKDGPADIYVARLIEPRSTSNFATVVRERRDGQWRVVWYPNCHSGDVRSFDVESKEQGMAGVERWAAKRGATLPARPPVERCAVFKYETRHL